MNVSQRENSVYNFIQDISGVHVSISLHHCQTAGGFMYLAYSLIIFGISVLVMWFILRHLEKRGEANCRDYLVGYLLVGLGPFLITILFTFVTSLFYFDGICYGFTGRPWDCTFWEYLRLELEYGLAIFVPAIGVAITAITLTFSVHWFFNRRGYLKDVQGGE
jgi:hypothetical protein